MKCLNLLRSQFNVCVFLLFAGSEIFALRQNELVSHTRLEGTHVSISNLGGHVPETVILTPVSSPRGNHESENRSK